jgi:hypothetical protein
MEIEVQVEEEERKGGEEACKVLVEVWKPGVCVRPCIDSSSSSPSASSSPPYPSPVLSELCHALLLSSPHVNIAGERMKDFRIVKWHGMSCLARIGRMTRWKGKEGEEEEDEEGEEEDVDQAIVTVDTQVECFIQATPPPPFLPAPPSPSSFPALFPHMSASAEDPDDCALIFEKEWKGMHQFVANAMRAHQALPSAPSPTSSSSPLPSAAQPSFGWSIPRAMLLAAQSGSGSSTLISAFVRALDAKRVVVRRVTGSELIGMGPCCALTIEVYFQSPAQY